ncbi:D-alanine--D-alanine ligase [Candidatus Poribacteria bacterium]|nr:MAG: D-alanine--D-alanine ligase [Candidatus Poribacteria bacterium]
MNVAVIFGGRSPEHEVSIVTAHQLKAALNDKYEVTLIYITKDGEWLTGDKLHELNTFTNGNLPNISDYDRVSVEFEKKPTFYNIPKRSGLFNKKSVLNIDVIFPAIHGVNGEDGTLQGLFELMNIPYVGAGVVGSCIGMDKIIMKSILSDSNLPILPYIWFTKHQWNTTSEDIIDRIEEKLGYPIFVKPAISGSSIGVSPARDQEELRNAIELACRYCQRIVVEEGIEQGYEINCSVMGTHNPIASVCEQPISNSDFLSFDDKYIHNTSDDSDDVSREGMAGAQRNIPAPISDDLTLHIQNLATDTFQILDCSGIARIDFIITSEDIVYVNEINTIPGSFSFYLWEPSEITFPQLSSELVTLALETHKEKNKLIYSNTTNLLSHAGASLGKLKD